MKLFHGHNFRYIFVVYSLFSANKELDIHVFQSKVECSLESGFVKGMRVEVANKSAPGTYWVASIIMTCGPLLRLRYEGYEEDGSADFWSDLSACEIHPIGWCTENGQVLQPPEGRSR